MVPGEKFGINRNIVECKSAKNYGQAADSVELIETLWNVNQEIDLTQKEVQTELIETLWNVNSSF